MKNYRGNSQSCLSSDHPQLMEIDLTLKLGLSIHDRQTSEEQNHFTTRGFPYMDGVAFNYNEMGGSSSMGAGQWSRNVEFSSLSASTYGMHEVPGSSNFLMYHEGSSLQGPATSTRRRHSIDDGKFCRACGANDTPLWRKGPDGPQTLCNACGLRHLRTAKKNGDQ